MHFSQAKLSYCEGSGCEITGLAHPCLKDRIVDYAITFFLCVIFRAFSFMIVIISPTHAQFTSLLRTLAYMFRPLRAIIRASQITKECRLKCVSMNKILEFYKTNG
jgi:hypothetical protein